MVFCCNFPSDCPRTSAINGLGCHVVDSHSWSTSSATPRISIVLYSHHYRWTVHCFAQDGCIFCVASRVWIVFIQTIAPTPQNKQTLWNSFHQINRWSNRFRQTNRQKPFYYSQFFTHSMRLWPRKNKACWEYLLWFELFSSDRSIKASFYNVRPLQRQRGVCICSQNTNSSPLSRKLR